MPEIVRTLKDGYWDRTTVVRAPDGNLRVRKESKQTHPPGPWAHAALRTEIAYLASLSEHAAPHFPPLLASWDDDSIGYEIPFYQNRIDFSKLLLAGRLKQGDCDRMQAALGEVLLDSVHEVVDESATCFADHLDEVIRESIDALSSHPQFERLIVSETIELNGRVLPGLRTSYERLISQGVVAALRPRPVVRLHGDLILENLLWSPLLLIDPVSVAGIDRGDPTFDLVKYESFASGELYAIREELVTAGPEGSGYRLHFPDQHPVLAPFRNFDLTTTFRAGWEQKHGAVNERLYAQLDAYFSLVMARNTTGTHRWARVLKACEALALATADG